MDTFARGLRVAAAIRADGQLDDFLTTRYGTWDTGIGAEIESGNHDFKSLSKYMMEKGDSDPNISGRQEYLENVINQYI